MGMRRRWLIVCGTVALLFGLACLSRPARHPGTEFVPGITNAIARKHAPWYRSAASRALLTVCMVADLRTNIDNLDDRDLLLKPSYIAQSGTNLTVLFTGEHGYCVVYAPETGTAIAYASPFLGASDDFEEALAKAYDSYYPNDTMAVLWALDELIAWVEAN